MNGSGGEPAGTGIDAATDPRPGGYRVIVPPGWERVRLESPARDRDVQQLVRRQFAGLDAPVLRRTVEAELCARAAAAADTGGVELYLSLLRRGPVVVPASLLISYTPPPAGDDGPDLPALAELLAGSGTAAQVLSCEVHRLGVGSAVRRLARYADGTRAWQEPGGGQERAELPAISLDWHLPVPAGAGALLTLSFSSPLVQLEAALIDLFDAIAGTFTWLW